MVNPYSFANVSPTAATSFFLRCHSLTHHSGASCISPDAQLLITSNLYDGFDCYSLETKAITHTYRIDITDNVPLQAAFTRQGLSAVLGGCHGEVTIWDARKDYSLQQTLRLDG